MRVIVGCDRTIPTGVGNSLRKRGSGGSFPDHPHRRGELSAADLPRVADNGPSPQAWGTRAVQRVTDQRARAIPTGVGNSAGGEFSGHVWPGHPHRRGELHRTHAGASGRSGPSPQAWGTQRLSAGPTGAERAIPTGVGNSSFRSESAWAAADHPHRRGELRRFFSATAHAGGPSPQAWGTPCGIFVPPVGVRTIPTGVGNSDATACVTSDWSDHPHRRGELLVQLTVDGQSAGPSPQAWGTRHAGGPVPGGRRTIPTGVGNSVRPARATEHDADHPHRRGELAAAAATELLANGPSPQAWGTLCVAARHVLSPRTIPTGVGNSWCHR